MPLQQTSGNDTADAYGGGAAAAVKYIENFFVTWLRTGTGASATVTTGLDASTNKALVWTKSRSAATDNKLTDTVRGATKALISNFTDTQTTDSTGLTAFSSTGYTIGANTDYNNSGATYVDWEFVATPKFFDVQTATVGASNILTFSHNLGSTPGFVIVKSIENTSTWACYHTSLGNDGILQLQSTAGAVTIPGTWSVSSTSVTLSNIFATGRSTVAYLFAHNAGGFGLTGTDNVISCGSFVGGASGNPVVTLGYEPQWVLFKESSAAGNDWVIVDTMRGFSQTGQEFLYPNTTAAAVGTSGWLTPTATGFQGQGSFNNTTYIYIAIRRGPMKVPTSGTSVYQAVARAGTGANATISGIGFTPDLWIDRYRTVGPDTVVTDRLRGISPYLATNSTTAESGFGGSGNISFDMSGVTVGTGAPFNASGNNYINWFFQRAPGFFDEVCYTGTGAAQNVTHNLGVAPELMIIKSRSGTQNWGVYSATIGNTKTLYLNLTLAASSANAAYWNNTSPTSSVFTVNTAGTNLSGETIVAYLFATCPGVSKVGSYTGTGATQTISCGFTGGARFVLVKRTDSTGDWYVWDTARGMVSGTDPSLLLNSTAAEVNANSIYTTTGGFQIVSTAAGINASGGTYIFLAIA